MQVIVETTSGLERKMKVVVPSEEIESKVTEKLKQTARQTRLNGFRPGKAPVREIKRRFGAGIRQEVSNDVIQATYGEALQQEDMDPASLPSIKDVKMEEGKDLEYTAVFEVFPAVTPAPFDEISVEKLKCDVSDEDMDMMIETLREQRLEYEAVERGGEKGDKQAIDIEGFIDGEPIEDGKAEGTEVIIGAGSMIPGIEDGLLGMKAGEEKNISAAFPPSYPAENLAGKDAVFKVKVNSVSAPQKPALDEEFFKLFGVEEGGLEAFRREVRNNMARELDAAIKAKVKQQVMDGLHDTNDLELPQSLVQQQIERLRRQAAQQVMGGGHEIDPSVLPAEMFSGQAERLVKLGLLTNAIVKQNNITADEDKVRETIETMAASYEEPDQFVRAFYQNEERLGQIQNLVAEEQMVEFIFASARVTEKTVAYEEAVKREEPPLPDASGGKDGPEPVKDDAA